MWSSFWEDPNISIWPVNRAHHKGSQSGALDSLRRQHALHFLALAETAEPELQGPHQTVWLDRLEAEHDNLRAALAWSLEPVECGAIAEPAVEMGLRVAGALWRFWAQRGYWSEGRTWLERALAASGIGGEPGGRTLAGAKALYGAGALARLQGDKGEARALLHASVAIFREITAATPDEDAVRRGLGWALAILGLSLLDHEDTVKARAAIEESITLFQAVRDKSGHAFSLNSLGDFALTQGDYERARVLFSESSLQCREAGHTRGLARALISLGATALAERDYARAASPIEESMALFRQVGDKAGIRWAFNHLAWVTLYQDDDTRAAALLGESLEQARELGDKEGLADSLDGLAGVAVKRGQAERAARLFGAAEAIRTSIGAPLPPATRAEYHFSVAATCTELGHVKFAATSAEGRAMALEQAIAYALDATR